MKKGRPIVHGDTVVDEVCDYFNLTRRDLACRLGLSKGAVSSWAKKNVIPIKWAKYFADESEGALDAFRLAGLD